MSIDALNWAKKRTAGSTGRKAALLLLADRADDYGVVYVGVDYLAKVLECHRDTVINHLAGLADARLIERIRRTNQDGSPTSSLSVLGARMADRGDLLDPREHDEHGALISKRLAAPPAAPKSGSSGPKSGNPKSGSSEPKSGSSPAQVGNPDSIQPPDTSPSRRSPAAVREEPVAMEPYRLPPELDQVASLLEQGGVQVLDMSFLVRLAESHPHVDLAEVARITVRRHQQGGLGRPEAYFRGIVTSDKPPAHTRATEAARVPEDQWEVVDPASGLRRAPDGTMLCSTPEQHAARQRILDGDAPVTNAWAEMAGGVG